MLVGGNGRAREFFAKHKQQLVSTAVERNCVHQSPSSFDAGWKDSREVQLKNGDDVPR